MQRYHDVSQPLLEAKIARTAEASHQLTDEPS